jgi:hypothetical protein
MTKLRSLVAVTLTVLLATFGSSIGATQTAVPQALVGGDPAQTGEVEGANAYTCCIIYHMGTWYCVPC